MKKQTKKLKIGILIDQLVAGGVQKSAIEEAKNLKTMGHEVTLFVLVRLDYDYQYQDLTQGITVIYLSDYNPWLFRRAIRIPYFAFLTHLHLLNPFFAHRYTILRELDFIVSHGTTTCITAQAISRKLRIPYMAFIWDPMIFIWEKVYSSTKARYLSPLIKPLIRYYERSFLTSAALTATPSKVHQKFIKDTYQVTPLIIHPGDLPPKTLPPKTGQFVLGYTRWELAKNPQLFLWLAKKLPQVSFLLAGSWTDSQEEKLFREQIKQLRLEKRIKLLSPITKKDLRKIASRSLVWLHPNFEAFGMAGLEMAALGLPIIIPKGSGVTELFQEGKHGFFPKANDKEAFLTSLKFILANPRKAAQMGKAAARMARQSTWKKHSQIVFEKVQEYHQQKKIVCLANAFVSTSSIGGGDRFLIELARRLPNKLHLTIILPKTGFVHYQQAEVKNPHIRYLLLPQNPFDNQDYPVPLFLAYLIRCFQTYFLLHRLSPFQVLHTATDLIPDTIPAFLFHHHQRQIPWSARFFHFIEPPLKREGRLWVNTGSWLLQRLSLRLLTQADLIMIDNPNLKRGLEKEGVAKDRIKLHPGGVETKEIAQAKPPPSYRSDAIFVGRLQSHKGIFDTVAVWKKVAKDIPRAKLIVIGFAPPAITQKVMSKIKKAGLEKNVLLTGYIKERKRVIAYMRSSKILLFLDHEAGFGLVNVEAMAAGLPVVAYNLPLFGTTFKKGFVTAPLYDTNKIAQLAIELLKNPQKYRIVSQEAKKEALNFDWSAASQRFYRQLLNVKSRVNQL